MNKIPTTRKLTMTLVAAIAVFVSQTSLAGDAKAGQEKAKTCFACHGADGNGLTPNFPNLAGQHESYLIKQMKEFKAGARKDPTMNAMLLTVDEQAMEDIASYFASQTIKPRQADPKQVALGKSIYKGGIRATHVPACMGCHGPTGSGNPGAKYPRLASQSATYIEKQLKDFRSAAQNPAQEEAPTGRYNDPSAMMRNAVKFMNDYEIKAVSQYIQGLQP